MVDPVRALGAVIKLIRDDQFLPDGDRAGFFPQGNPSDPAAPIFQPKTPGTFRMPMNPAPAPGTAQAPGLSQADVKEEPQVADGPARVITEEIELVTTESETSTSGDDFAESDAESEHELEPACQDVLNEDLNVAWVQHKKTKIIHAIKGVWAVRCQDRCTPMARWFRTEPTNCGQLRDCHGRLTGANFVIVTEIGDWTSKCRLCFKGNRDPRAHLR